MVKYGGAVIPPPILAAEPGSDGLSLLQVAIQHRQIIGGILSQPGVLPGPRFRLEQLNRLPVILDLIGDELPVEIRPRQKSRAGSLAVSQARRPFVGGVGASSGARSPADGP